LKKKPEGDQQIKKKGYYITIGLAHLSIGLIGSDPVHPF
jgi:hypothetical protein